MEFLTYYVELFQPPTIGGGSVVSLDASLRWHDKGMTLLAYIELRLTIKEEEK
jgi:hypothetical protein